MWLNWPLVRTMPWKQRNAAIEAAVRTYLGAYSGPALSSYDLAVRITLTETATPETAQLSQVLSRMAPHLPTLATHDGEKIKRYGKTWQRWRWHGRKSTAAQVLRAIDPPADFDPTCVLCQSGEEHEH